MTHVVNGKLIQRGTWISPTVALGVWLLISLTGCNSETVVETGEVLDESWFSLEQTGKAAPNAPAGDVVAKASLGVNLERGTKFPLQKIVEKTLTQSTLQGPIESTERIELFISVTVEELRDRNKKFRILYNRVKYDSNLGGQIVHYDSQQPQYPLPDTVLAYHGMVNNGFSFWVGADNRITDVVDFSDFLRRCLAQVPVHKSEAVSQTLASYSGQEGIANFVDDTIGLLPYDPNSADGSSVVRLGGHWSKSRHYNEPVPMSLNSTYTLKELNDDYAKVEVLGDVVPAAAVSNPQQGMSFQVLQGHSAGTCTIDLKTGLPLNSRIDHQMSMSVQLNGIQFDQHKRVVTSIRMFPEQEQGRVQQFAADEESQPGPTGLSLTPVSRPQTQGY